MKRWFYLRMSCWSSLCCPLGLRKGTGTPCDFWRWVWNGQRKHAALFGKRTKTPQIMFKGSFKKKTGNALICIYLLIDWLSKSFCQVMVSLFYPAYGILTKITMSSAPCNVLWRSAFYSELFWGTLSARSTLWILAWRPPPPATPQYSIRIERLAV